MSLRQWSPSVQFGSKCCSDCVYVLLCICKACNCFICCSMMQQEVQEMSDYQNVNPYEMMYRNMNFEINQHITKDNAEKIARQLGFMHNAFGIIAKDLIKILSFKFSNEPSHPRTPSSQRVFHRVDPKYRQPPPLDCMEGEDPATWLENQHGSKKRVVQTEEEKMVAVPVHEKEVASETIQKQDRIQEQPPNLDFLGEFAYQKSGHQQSKKAKDKLKDSFKEKLSRIVEEVSNKKKKTSKSTKNSHEEESKDPPSVPSSKGKDVHHSSPESHQSKATPISNEQESKVLDKPSPPEGQSSGLFEEFQFKRQQKSPVIPVEEQQQSPKTNKLWHLLQHNRDQPQVYEISDDDD